jgi:hypothetical protein
MPDLVFGFMLVVAGWLTVVLPGYPPRRALTLLLIRCSRLPARLAIGLRSLTTAWVNAAHSV